MTLPGGWRVALVHHWLVAARGGERVLEALADLFPTADLYTLVCDRSQIPPRLRTRDIRTSPLQHLPGATHWHRYYLPLFPLAARALDLTSYDLVVSSDAAMVKGVRTGRRSTHVCYCHTPMRCVWDHRTGSRSAAGPLERSALRAFRKSLCRWDYLAAQGVTRFVANSKTVQERIRDSYDRESTLIYPPVDTNLFSIDADQSSGNVFLLVSHLVPYKRVDLVVDAFNLCGRPLTVIGDGPERRRLEARARSNIRFLGFQPTAEVVRAMRQCRAFVFAGEEDFGIVMAEAQACGKPVIALGRGGATEIVRPGATGILFAEASPGSLLEALDRFDQARFDPHAARKSALKFARDRFLREFSALIAEVAGAGGVNRVPA